MLTCTYTKNTKNDVMGGVGCAADCACVNSNTWMWREFCEYLSLDVQTKIGVFTVFYNLDHLLRMMESFIAGTDKSSHPPFNDMVLETIATLRERKGSSRQKIVKFIGENYDVGAGYERQVNLALKRGVSRGTLLQVRGTGASGSFKINKGNAGGNASGATLARVKVSQVRANFHEI